MNKNKDILLYIKCITWVITPFCLLGSLHYLFVFFPRLVKEDESIIELSHLDYDYFGVITGFFAVLVTLLVGWQIFNMIKAKDEVERISNGVKASVKLDYGDRLTKIEKKLKEFEDCCNDRKKEISDLATSNKNIYLISKARFEFLMSSQLYTDGVIQFNGLNMDRDAQSYISSFTRIMDALDSYLKAIDESCIFEIKACLIYMRTDIQCLALFFTLREAGMSEINDIYFWIMRSYEEYKNRNGDYAAKILNSKFTEQLYGYFSRYKEAFEKLYQLALQQNKNEK